MPKLSKKAANPSLQGDRYIPTFSHNSDLLDLQSYKLNSPPQLSEEFEDAYLNSLSESLFKLPYNKLQSSPILNFSIPETYLPKPRRSSPLFQIYKTASIPLKYEMEDDYYKNLLCWISYESINGPAVGMYSQTAIFDFEKDREMSLSGTTTISSLAYNNKFLVQGRYADYEGSIEFIDFERQQIVNHYSQNSASTKILPNDEHCFYAMSKYGNSLILYDTRCEAEVSTSYFPIPLVGVSLNPSKTAFAMSLGRTILIYDPKMMAGPTFGFKGHEVPSKALAFSPYNSSLIASGGGTSDHSLKIWNFQTGKVLAESQRGNQICDIYWRTRQDLFCSEGNFHPQVSCFKIKNNKLDLTSSVPLEKRNVYSCQDPSNPEKIVTANGGKYPRLNFWSMNTRKKPGVQSSLEETESFIRTIR